MFGWEFPPYNSGGLGTACFGLSRALVRQNVRITFVLPKRLAVSSNDLRLVFADEHAIKLTEVNSLLYPYVTSEEYILDREHIKNDIYGRTLLEEVVRYARAARKIAKKEQFDIIHAHDWLSFLAGIEAKNVSGKPLVVHVHATEFDRTGGQGVNQNVYNIERRGLHFADKIIAVSNLTKQKIVEHYGINPSKIKVIHNGVDREDYRKLSEQLAHLKRENKKIVLYAGRITIQKGPEYFIRAARRVLDYYPDAVFVVAGSGDMERQIMMEAAYLGISDRILFAGFLRGDELNAIYQAADLYVMPSVSEPFGITPLEALVNDTPVLISRQSGVSEVLTHALKSDFWDTEDMANKIISVLMHNSLKETLRENGCREVEKISWKEAARKCVDLYRNILSGYSMQT
jgi:glycogen(starch) synthase